MTSQERHEARFQRRKLAREKKKEELNKVYGNFDDIISHEALYNSYYQCKKTVSWKASTQKYGINLLQNIYITRQKLIKGESISKGFHHFTLNERGKVRQIRSVHISERVVQKSLNQNCLTPILSKSLIYENSASLPGKGIKAAQDQLVHDLCEFYQENKRSNDGYILLIDFSKYFDNILHEPIYKDLERKITDERILKLVKQCVDPFGKKSLGLGSEVSQILALNYANPIDHFIREVLHINKHCRYMDDTYIIHKDKKYLQYCLDKIIEKCAEYGIIVNTKKTHIFKLSHKFTFLKTKYFLTKNGKVVRQLRRESITRMRRKLKKLQKFFIAGEVTRADIRCTWASWQGYMMRKNSYHIQQSMTKLYKDLFVDLFLIQEMEEMIQQLERQREYEEEQFLIQVAEAA